VEYWRTGLLNNFLISAPARLSNSDHSCTVVPVLWHFRGGPSGHEVDRNRKLRSASSIAQMHLSPSVRFILVTETLGRGS